MKNIDYIPTVHLISAVIIFGLMWYVFNPIVTGLSSFFGITSATNVYAAGMFFLWMALPAINLFVSGIRFIMKMQEQRG